MQPTAHIVQGTVSTAVLYPYFGERALLFGLAVVLIDLDHVIEYLWDTRDWSLRGFFVYHAFLSRNLAANYLSFSAFHTLELYALGAVLARWYPALWFVVAGFVFHHLFDLIGMARTGYPWSKSFSFTDYFLRRHRYLRSIRDVLRHPAATTEGIAGIDRWKTRWGAGTPAGSRR